MKIEKNIFWHHQKVHKTIIHLIMTHQMTPPPEANETHFQTLDTTSILNFSFQVILFSIGLFAQIEIIKVCKEEKNKTWQIHIFHSITMTVLFASRLIFMAIGYLSPSVLLPLEAGYAIYSCSCSFMDLFLSYPTLSS